MSTDAKKPKPETKVLLEISSRSAVDRLTGVSGDVEIERGERKLFTKAEAKALLALTHDGEPVLQKAIPQPGVSA